MASAYDAVVVGSGPNGLSAAIALQQKGVSVLLIEGSDTIGGGMRTKELTLPGFQHDVCSAVHPMALMSPFLRTLPLSQFGLEMIQPTYAAAHPFDDGSAAVLHQSLQKTAEGLGVDRAAYENYMGPLVKDIPDLLSALLGPLAWPEHPVKLGLFGLKALASAKLASRRFKTEKAKGLWAGVAAHAIQPLENPATAAFGIMLTAAAHLHGWPVPKGGSQSLANAMLKYFESLGGKVQTGFWVKSLNDLPSSKTVLLDVTPRQLLSIAADKLSSSYRRRLEKYRYGIGVFKVDWALDGPVPFNAEECSGAGTVHLGNTFAEIAAAESATHKGRYVEKPYVLLAQQSAFDCSRAPEGKQVLWGYCHVPHGSTRDMTNEIESQIERFAPGFRGRILARHTMNGAELEQYNPNYIGGDINGGVQDLLQLYTRPVAAVSPYRTSANGVYICSSSTPPGGGVHGMSGYHAARQALKDVFKINI